MANQLSSFKKMPYFNLKLRHATNLTPKDIGGTSDPIVICTINGKKSFKTEPIMMDCNPNWEINKKIKREFVVNFDKMTDVVLLQVEDYNIFSKNKPIGSCQIPLSVLEQSKPMEFTFDLRDKGGNLSGRLTTVLEAIDFGIVQKPPPSSMYPQQYPPFQQPQLTNVNPQLGTLQRNGSILLSNMRHGSFLSNGPQLSQQQQNAAVIPIGNGGMQPLTQRNSFILYPQQQQQQQQIYTSLPQGNVPPPQNTSFSPQGNMPPQGNVTQANIPPLGNVPPPQNTSFSPQMGYPQQQFSQNVSSPGSLSPNLQRQSLNSSSIYNLSGNSYNQSQMNSTSNVQQSQQNESNSISSTPRKALPTLPVKQSVPQNSQPSVDQYNIPKPNELSQSNIQPVQWNGVATDQYIDYVVSQLPIPLSIEEYDERFVRPFKL